MVADLTAVADLAEDLINNHNFKFVLLGKTFSDVIEARFGCYRQLSGCNFFISIRQLLDSEKKIRVPSKLRDLTNAISAETSISTVIPSSSVPIPTPEDVNYITDELHVVSAGEGVSSEDQTIIFYVAGYIGRTVSHQRKCTSCQELLIFNTTDALELNVDESIKGDEDVRTLLEMANRGGLAKPTELTFTICVVIY